MQKLYKNEKMLIFNYLFLSETNEPAHPLFGTILKSWIVSIEADFQMRFTLISFNFFYYQFWNLATFSGPLSKLVPHFLVHSYSSANSMHV